MTLNEARSTVHKELSKHDFGEPFVILDDATEERESCFVFYWTLQSAQGGGSPIAGNAPYLVDRRSGRIYSTGTCFSTAKFIEAFERFGDPAVAFGKLPCAITITGWRKGAQKVSATQCLRDSGRFTLGPAKAAIDSVLRGEVISICDLTPEAADSLAKELENFGFTTLLSTNKSEPRVAANAATRHG